MIFPLRSCKGKRFFHTVRNVHESVQVTAHTSLLVLAPGRFSILDAILVLTLLLASILLTTSVPVTALWSVSVLLPARSLVRSTALALSL